MTQESTEETSQAAQLVVRSLRPCRPRHVFIIRVRERRIGQVQQFECAFRGVCRPATDGPGEVALNGVAFRSTLANSQPP